MKPALGQMQKITDKYFDGNAPKVSWIISDQEKGLEGIALPEENEIHLNKNISREQTGCAVDCDVGIKHDPIELEEDEQYYFVLLHEIAHFLVKPESLEKLEKIKRKMETELPGKDLLYYIEDYIEQEENESDEEWQFRVQQFRSFLRGHDIADHMVVENWAMEKFNELKQNNFKV